jgi:hypothetical protein
VTIVGKTWITGIVSRVKDRVGEEVCAAVAFDPDWFLTASSATAHLREDAEAIFLRLLEREEQGPTR